MKKIKLFCIPYAGGSASIYNMWNKYLDPIIELCALEFSGRGKREKEPPFLSIEELLGDMLNRICDCLSTGSPYALFGHSFGALIAYRLSLMITERNIPLPHHLFISGRSAPNILNIQERKIIQMDDTDMMTSIFNLGGIPKSLFNHRIIKKKILANLKNDFRLVRNDKYEYKSISPLQVNMTILHGKNEGYTKKQIVEWKKHTNKTCSIISFEGGHFFIHQYKTDIIGIVNKVLTSDNGQEILKTYNKNHYDKN